MEDGLFPSSQSRFDPERLEEERRLCYVGITRAREELRLSYAKQRMIYGRIEPSLPSPFLEEMKDALPEQPKPEPKKETRKFASSEQTYDRHSLQRPQQKPLRFDTPRGSSAAQQKNSSTTYGAAKPSPANTSIPLEIGMRVAHKSFGAGTVLSLGGSGTNRIVEIDFDNGQTKKFAAAYAPITPMED